MSRRLYALHRWLSAITFVQLTIWTVSGLFFTVVPMSRVHGEHVEGAHDVPIGPAPGALTPTSALACFAAMGVSNVHRMELRARPAGLYYIAWTHEGAARIDARTCAAAPVDRAEAEESARRDQPGGARRPISAAHRAGGRRIPRQAVARVESGARGRGRDRRLCGRAHG